MNWGKIMLSVDEFINYSDKYYAHIIQETSEEISRTEIFYYACRGQEV